VTICVVPFDITAVAVNWAELPGSADDAGAVTVTDETVGAEGVGLVGGLPPPPQLASVNAITREQTHAGKR
jgi:hypothetical protein